GIGIGDFQTPEPGIAAANSQSVLVRIAVDNHAFAVVVAYYDWIRRRSIQEGCKSVIGGGVIYAAAQPDCVSGQNSRGLVESRRQIPGVVAAAVPRGRARGRDE